MKKLPKAEGALLIISVNLKNLSRVEKFIVDGGYSGEKFANAVKKIHGANVEVVKKSDLHKFEVITKRWIVKRTFAWLDKNRRLWKNCERKLRIFLQMIVLVSLALILKRF